MYSHEVGLEEQEGITQGYRLHQAIQTSMGGLQYIPGSRKWEVT